MDVRLENLSKHFPSRDRKGETVVAVDRFNISIPDGKLVSLLGPSGCGKSTVLNLISGLLPPTEGSVYFGDEDVTKIPPERRGVGLVFQNYALYPHLTVEKNILFPLQNLKGKDKLTKEQMAEKVRHAAQLVQIESLMHRKPSEMSGGQQQRVAIARALVKMPRVLLLDEPLSNLDARLRLQTREEIKKVQNKTGITTIFVTHDQEEAMSISDMIIVMEKGRLCQYGHPQEVYDDPNSLFVAKFLGTPPINVFNGHVRNERLFLAEDEVLPVPGVPDGDVTVGIRPEGFVPDPEGNLRCALHSIEVLGRDTSVVSAHPAAQTETIRSIISAKNKGGISMPEVRFSLDPDKVLLFDPATGKRIYFRKGAAE